MWKMTKFQVKMPRLENASGILTIVLANLIINML